MKEVVLFSFEEFERYLIEISRVNIFKQRRVMINVFDVFK